MKKTLLLTSLSLFSLSVAIPAIAAEDNTDNNSSKWRDRIENFKGNKEGHYLKEKKGMMKGVVFQDENAKVGWGEITAISDNKITINIVDRELDHEPKHPDKQLSVGSYEVLINDDTKTHRKFMGASDVSEFSVADKIHIGVKVEDGVYTALFLKDNSIFNTKRPLRAEVQSVDLDNNSLTVKKGERQFVVEVDEDTKVMIDKEEAQLSEVKTGDRIMVKGIVNRDLSNMFAKVINVFRKTTDKMGSWIK